VNDTSIDTAEVQALASDFDALGRTSSSLAEDFRAHAGPANSQSVLGSSRTAASFDSAYHQALTAVNQITTSLSAIGHKLSVVATNVSDASAASTARSSP
jgi:uncharacterized protein YukE